MEAQERNVISMYNRGGYEQSCVHNVCGSDKKTRRGGDGQEERKDLGLMGAKGRKAAHVRPISLDLHGPMENPAREICVGGFLQFFKEQVP
jgi:hypothetical protein